MKKFFAFAAAALMCGTAFANLTVNNPKGEDGGYIVKWDCAADTWAASNDFEVDETFTFAVDITGTPFEDYVKETPESTSGEGRYMMAFNKWTNLGGLNGDAVRLKQIKGNIYGATFNLYQELLEGKDTVVVAGTEVVVFGQIFCFIGTDVIDNDGGWWKWPAGLDPEASYVSLVEGDATTQADQWFFKTMPYTGEKTSEEFINGDYIGMWEANYATVPGYAAACATEAPEAIVNKFAAPKAHKVIEGNQLVLISNGVRYNVLGAIVK